MSNVVPNTYPLDYSGEAASNRIQAEQVTLSAGTLRGFCPLYSPFFGHNLQIVDSISGLQLQPSQYSLRGLVPSASALTPVGKPVYSLIVITDEEVSAQLAVTYQTIGSHYTSGYDSIMGMLRNLLGTDQVTNNDPIEWSTLQNLEQGFPTNLHLHELGDTVGWEFLVAALEKLRQAVLFGDQLSKTFVLSYIDQATAAAIALRQNVAAPGTPLGDHISAQGNVHNVQKADIGLGNVQNYPVATLSEALAGVRTDRYLTAELVTAVVQNRINLGLDAHIALRDNPHDVNKAQVGLSLVHNYAPASAGELQNPTPGIQRYVTNATARDWIAAHFQSLLSPLTAPATQAAALATIAKTNADQAAEDAAAALQNVTQAVADIANAVERADAALLQAGANQTSIDNSNTAAIALLQEYVSQAIVAAEAAAYARGVNDGLAANN